MFCQLGNIKFEGLNTPSSWGESQAVKYGEIAHIGGKPSIQFAAEELTSIDFQIRISDNFCDVSETIENLEIAKSTGEVLPLITGHGFLVGKFVIESLSISYRKTQSNGKLTSADVGISLKEYVSPPGKQQPNNGTAIIGNGAIPQPPAIPVTTKPQSLMKDISKAKSNVTVIKNTLTAVQRGTKSLKRGVRDAKRTANTVKTLYSSAKTKLNQTVKIAQRATQLPTSLDEAIAYADNLARIDNLASMSELENNTNNVVRSADKVSNHASSGASFVGTKEGGS